MGSGAGRRAVIGGAVAAVWAIAALAPAAQAYTFKPATDSPYALEGTPESAAVGDFNGDGRADFAVGSDTYSVADTDGQGLVSVFLASADGGFHLASGSPTQAPIVLGQGLVALTAADFNHDGRLDLAAANDGSVTVLLSNGDGTFTKAPGGPVALGHDPWHISEADLNGDGIPDLVTLNSDDTVSVLLGNGDGTFSQAPGSPISLSGGQPGSLAIADFNGDGKPDVAVTSATSGELTILLGNGDGTFTPAPGSPISLSGLPAGLVATDFNGDGKQDLAVGNTPYAGVTVLLGNGDGTFTQAPESPYGVEGQYPSGMFAGDLNDDGKPDIAYTAGNGYNGTNALYLLLGDGAGGFSSAAGSPFTVDQPGQVPDLLAGGSFGGRKGLVLAPGTCCGAGTEDAVSVLLAPLPSDPPSAGLSAAPDPALTGTPVKLDASGSSDPLDRPIVDYQWDLGSGSFSDDTGAEPTITHAFSSSGSEQIRVRVTNSAGETAIAELTVTVRPAPPPGPIGISIDDGDYATNTPNVVLNVVWPAFASAALISNDGGFGSAGGTTTVPLAAQIPWTLRTEGPERLLKIVYLRFPDSGSPTETFSDDILLDTLRPTVQAAAVFGKRDEASASRATRRAFRIRLIASERRSGIYAAQFWSPRSKPTTLYFGSRSRRGILRLRRTLTVRMRTQPRSVRVRDTAGTWSRWRPVTG